MRRLLFLIFSFSILALVTLAASRPVTRTRMTDLRNCYSWAICVDEAGTGACQDSTNRDELVAYVAGRTWLTFDSTESSATVWACDLYSNSSGYTATALDKQQINTVSLSNTNKILSYNGGPLLYVWAECGTNTGTDIDITVVACE